MMQLRGPSEASLGNTKVSRVGMGMPRKDRHDKDGATSSVNGHHHVIPSNNSRTKGVQAELLTEPNNYPLLNSGFVPSGDETAKSTATGAQCSNVIDSCQGKEGVVPGALWRSGSFVASAEPFLLHRVRYGVQIPRAKHIKQRT